VNIHKVASALIGVGIHFSYYEGSLFAHDHRIDVTNNTVVISRDGDKSTGVSYYYLSEVIAVMRYIKSRN
jgi:hypothetical protein